RGLIVTGVQTCALPISEGSASLITIRPLRPAQLVGVPDKVRINVSQFTPSTQVLSSNDEPPGAVPAQFTVGPLGLSVPALGVARSEERRVGKVWSGRWW